MTRGLSPSAEIVPAGDGTLVLRGRLDSAAIGTLWPRAMEHASGAGALVVDASALEYCDGAGAALLLELRRRREAAGGGFELRGLHQEFQSLLAMIEPSPEGPQEQAPARDGFFEGLGRATLEVLSDLRALVSYVGQITLQLAGAIRHPSRLRFQDVALIAERAGVGAIPVMLLIGFLLGLILAFQSAIPMQRFGAEIFVADLLAISMLRELGPLMASILLTARSGSAFTAEIGTMKVNEEVDALTTMGLEPIRFLVLPRIVAALLVVPALIQVVNLAGLVGGAVVFLSLDFPLVTYFNRVTAAVGPVDFLGGIFKGFVFGIIVAAVGCLRGLQTGKGAGAVGVSTTSSVVSGIILIGIVDGIFAVVFYILGI